MTYIIHLASPLLIISIHYSGKGSQTTFYLSFGYSTKESFDSVYLISDYGILLSNLIPTFNYRLQYLYWSSKSNISQLCCWHRWVLVKFLKVDDYPFIFKGTILLLLLLLKNISKNISYFWMNSEMSGVLV